MKAKEWGLADKVRVYDSGIFNYAKIAPNRILFLGQTVTAEEIAEKQISETSFTSRTLPPSAFIVKVRNPDYQVFDLRDFKERDAFPLKLPGLQHYLLDRFKILLQAKSRKVTRKKLLILDNVGKQVRWLDYILQMEGYDEYFFLKGGILQWQLDGYDQQGLKCG